MTTADIHAFAPAKINLTLHVTGQRADGYHLLDSLVVFADIGDHLTLRAAPGLTLTVTGPMARDVPDDIRNLALRAAHAAGADNLAIHLEKHLPAAAGIGGGSSDAGAVLRALRDDCGLAPPDPLNLGADVPVCLYARTARMSGIGETVTPVDGIPPLAAVLLNPRIQVPTADIFAMLTSRDNLPMGAIPAFANVTACVDWLAQQRNDLQLPAGTLNPIIGTCLSALADQNALLTRMSGSGATCFGLFADEQTASQAAAALTRRHPDWWVRPTLLVDRPQYAHLAQQGACA